MTRPIPEQTTCECVDAGCTCSGRCAAPSTTVLYRIDMEDYSGTAMCDDCASDALDSGVFTTEPEAGEDDKPEPA